MTDKTEQVFDCKEPCDPPCPGKVHYTPDPHEKVTGLWNESKIIYLKCDNPKGHHINPYEVEA